MHYSKMKKLVPLLTIVGLLTLETRLQATPYASGITNNAGTVSYILNESADSVKVVFDGGGIGNTNDLGAMTKGVHSFSLDAHTSWQIEVKKSSAQIWTQISADTNVFNQFFSPRSAAVNRNPASPYFGRVYVMEYGNSTGTGTTGSGRSITKGVFALNGDLSDALGQGNTGLKGGLDAYNLLASTANSSYEPWKLVVGEDDYVYISDAQNARGALARVDANLANGNLVLAGVGNTARPDLHTVVYGIKVTGSLAAGTLSVLGIDGQWSAGANSVVRWNVNGGAPGLPTETTPTQLFVATTGGAAEQDSDLDVHPNGNIFVQIYRSTVNGPTPGLQVFNPSGTRLYTSFNGSTDAFLAVRNLKISPDGSKLALLRNDRQVVILGLTNGVPDLSSSNLLATFPTSTSAGTRSVDWDAAGNLYVGNNSTELLRVFSPGGTKTAVTTSGGTFQLIVPPTIVNVTATPVASEEGPTNGIFTLTRDGDSSVPLTVNYTLSGTASNGMDYATLPLSVTFLAGSISTNIILVVSNDLIPELTETAVLTIGGSVSYGIGTGSATISILDNETPEISFGTTITNKLLESYAPSKVSLQLQRRGLLTSPIAVNLAYSGTATRGADFNGPLTATIPANTASANITLTSTNDQGV